MSFLRQKLIWVLAALLLATACGGSGEADIRAPEGPALVMVYTDN